MQPDYILKMQHLVSEKLGFLRVLRFPWVKVTPDCTWDATKKI